MSDIEQDERRSHHVGTPDPSSDYDGCSTATEIDNRYRELFAAATKKYSRRKAGTPHDVRDALQEDHRRAHVRLVGRFTSRSTEPRVTVPVVLQPTETTDGLVIECQGPCGETKPANKFPTRSGGRPGREAVCRACRDARIADQKAKRKN